MGSQHRRRGCAAEAATSCRRVPVLRHYDVSTLEFPRDLDVAGISSMNYRLRLGLHFTVVSLAVAFR